MGADDKWSMENKKEGRGGKGWKGLDELWRRRKGWKENERSKGRRWRRQERV